MLEDNESYLRLILRKIASALREQWHVRRENMAFTVGKTPETPLRVANTTYYDYSVGRFREYSWSCLPVDFCNQRPGFEAGVVSSDIGWKHYPGYFIVK
jgi:hypothetical protein